MNKHSEILIVGGGVIGLSIARRLGRAGRRVRLLERGTCGREASWAGAGIISPRSPHRKDPMARLVARSIELYQSFCSALREESGIDTEYDWCGELHLIFDENELNIARSEAGVVAGQTTESGKPLIQVYDAAELREVEPATNPDALGGALYRSAAQVRNPRLLQALRESCRRAGVVISEGTTVEDVVTAGEIVTGVRTETETIHCRRVILCAGAWSSRVHPHLDTLIPVHPVRGQMVLLRIDPKPFDRVICSGRSYLVPRRDGHILLGATEEPNAGFTTRSTAKGVAHLIDVGLRLVPGLADAGIQATWAGLRPGTPDDKPYLGPVPGFDGLIVATGHFRTGLTLAPVTAELVTSMIDGEGYDIDLSAFRPGRA